jgi:hypothetical protein
MFLGPFEFTASHLGDYMHRWIFRTPWFTVRLHHILRSDDDRHFHDHPFDFTSFLLTGGYIEQTPLPGLPPQFFTIRRHWPQFSIVRRKAEDLHKLTLTKPVWTFVISGPKRREWGFETEQGWVHWEEYPHKFPTIKGIRT